MPTTGQFSGATRAFVIGHIVPVSVERDRIAAMADSDGITIEAELRLPEVALNDTQVADRLARCHAPASTYSRGATAKYARLVADVSRGG